MCQWWRGKSLPTQTGWPWGESPKPLSAELLPQGIVFLLKVFDHALLMSIDQPATVSIRKCSDKAFIDPSLGPRRPAESAEIVDSMFA